MICSFEATRVTIRSESASDFFLNSNDRGFSISHCARGALFFHLYILLRILPRLKLLQNLRLNIDYYNNQVF